jgi:hypothetical protein
MAKSNFNFNVFAEKESLKTMGLTSPTGSTIWGSFSLADKKNMYLRKR